MDDVSFLTIYKTEYPKQRIGSANDGGYIIATGISYNLLLSCGISNDITFEENFLKLYDVNCYAFDGTIQSLPAPNTKINFIPKNIANKETANTTTMLDIIKQNDNIFLKMDIETNEYQWLEIIDTEDLKRFSQIVIEFHFPFDESRNDLFQMLSFPISTERKINCLKKLAETHYLVHLHGNNCCSVTNYNNVTVPNVFECTYIRKDLCKSVEFNKISIPDKDLDRPNSKDVDDIYLTGYPFTQ